MSSVPPASAQRHLPMLFSERGTAFKVFALLPAPAIVAVLVWLCLGWSAAAYWGLQAVAVVAAVFSGQEHRRSAEAALRGAWGGAMFAATLLTCRAISDADEVVEFPDPGAFAVVAVLASAGLVALGSGWRRRLER